ncbi:Hypothetical predicted protein [Octopus vulgaris]|uniref:Uncharacterized protein n=1 Tax=Octopus vulgaris TaxID=6645 RepID=A0AA36FB86_OCTVU|nr:Hypothetical predicted protein [Octopus vulgaris]
MSEEFVENMDEYFGVRMDMEFIRIGKEHSSDGENQRTVTSVGTVFGTVFAAVNTATAAIVSRIFFYCYTARHRKLLS